MLLPLTKILCATLEAALFEGGQVGVAGRAWRDGGMIASAGTGGVLAAVWVEDVVDAL